MVCIRSIIHDPPGLDHRSRLNAEYVVLQNSGFYRVSLAGWKLCDLANHTYVFPDVLANGGRWYLNPNDLVFVHTGSGVDCYQNNEYHLFWNRRWWVWNNKGDTAYLFDQDANLIDWRVVRGAA
jgi:hypothetical protein